MKPRIVKYKESWFCYCGVAYGYGSSPESAYSSWSQHLLLLRAEHGVYS